jgi:hypothetical protein
MKQPFKTLTALALVLALAAGPTALPETAKAATTGASLPDLPAYGGLKWSYQAGTGFSNALTPPTVAGDAVFVGSGNKIYRLDRETGALSGTATLADTFGFATAALTYAADVDGRNVLFAPISEGRVQAVDADTMESLWVTETLLGQSCLARVVYDQGYIYYGTWRTETGEGKFLCYDTTDPNPASPTETKTKTWQVAKTGGFYWSEACVAGDTVVFGSEDGLSGYTSPTSLVYSCMKGGDFAAAGKSAADSPVLDSVGTTGDLRSGVVYDALTDAYYFTSRAGLLYKAVLEADGTFPETGALKSLSLGGVTTGTPAIWQGTLFLGVQGPTPYGADGHSLRAVDGASMTQVLSAPTPGFVQAEPLLSTAAAGSGKLALYLTFNQLPGGIYLATLSKDGDSWSLVPERTGMLFTPPLGMQNYGISTLASDDAGNLYYKNDSCNLMAVKAGYMLESRSSAGGTIEGTATVAAGESYTFHMTPATGYMRVDTLVDGTSLGALESHTFSAVSAPHWIKPVFAPVTTPTPVSAVSAGYSSVKLSWASAPGVTTWQIFRATSATGTYTHIASVPAGTLSYTNTGLVTGKTYYYKLRSYYRGTTGLATLSALSAGYKSAAPRLATPSITTTPGTDRIKVAWKAVAGAQGYRIYRKTSATGSYSLVKIVTSGATTSWTQYGLVTGRTYYYVIRAYRVVDGTTQYSFLSNVSAAKPT